jgi:hypothetical protein
MLVRVQLRAPTKVEICPDSRNGTGIDIRNQVEKLQIPVYYSGALNFYRSVAQFVSASGLGPEGCRLKSDLSDCGRSSMVEHKVVALVMSVRL